MDIYLHHVNIARYMYTVNLTPFMEVFEHDQGSYPPFLYTQISMQAST